MIASSSSSPPTRMDWETTIPPSEITATSEVPPPMSTTMLPVGSPTGRPAPIAAAIGSSMRYALGAPPRTDAPPHPRLLRPGPQGSPPGPRAPRRGYARGQAPPGPGGGPGGLVHLLDEVAEHLLRHV